MECESVDFISLSLLSDNNDLQGGWQWVIRLM